MKENIIKGNRINGRIEKTDDGTALIVRYPTPENWKECDCAMCKLGKLLCKKILEE